MTDEDRRQPIAIGHLSYSGDLKQNLHVHVHLKSSSLSIKTASIQVYKSEWL